MGLFSKRRRAEISHFKIDPDSHDYRFDIVGELHRRDELRSIMAAVPSSVITRDGW